MMHKFSHTPYTKRQTSKLVVASFTTNIMFTTNYVCVGSQNDPTLHEHVVQGPHVVMGKVLFVLVHLSMPIVRNFLPI